MTTIHVTTARRAVLLALLLAAPLAAAQTVNDGHSKEWQQFKPFAGASWNGVATYCPQDGATACSGPNGQRSDWIWATADQVQQLMSYYAPEMATQASSNNFVAAASFLGSFQPIFSFCLTYQCGASGAGLTSSKEPYGVPIVGSAGWSTTSVSFGGGLGVGPSGDPAVGSSSVGVFYFRFTGPGVFAYDDAGSVSNPDGGTAVANVMTNDWIAGVRVTLANVNLRLESSSDPGVTLDLNDGSVDVANGTAVGTHTLVYWICDLANPDACDDALVSVQVKPYVIDAVNDAGGISPATGGAAIASILANDLLGGRRAATATVQLSTVSLTPTVAGITLDPASGAVLVAQGTALGSYVLVYRICEIANPGNCDTATATVSVRPNAIDAVDDYGRGSSKTANTVIANVLANDTLDGQRAVTPTVVLSQVSLVPASSGISLNLSTGAVSVKAKTTSGSYALTYRICEAASPANCDTAVATVELSGKAN